MFMHDLLKLEITNSMCRQNDSIRFQCTEVIYLCVVTIIFLEVSLALDLFFFEISNQDNTFLFI